MPRTVLRIGTRSSALALAQAESVRRAINEVLPKRSFELVPIHAEGDRTAGPLPAGGKGLFVSDIQQSLADGRIDLAVHSAKDLPAGSPDGVALAAITEREDPRDVLLTRHGGGLERLEPGTTFGTSSLRRVAQLLAMGRGFVPVPIRGNVDTRLRKLSKGDVTALVVALAGLRRLGKDERIVQVFPVSMMMPAPGQGALAVECRAGDKEMRAALGRIEHVPTRLAYEAERAFMVAVGGDCALPLGALATMPEEGRLRLRALVATPDGKRVLRDEETGDDPLLVAEMLAKRMNESGAAEIVAAAREPA